MVQMKINTFSNLITRATSHCNTCWFSKWHTAHGAFSTAGGFMEHVTAFKFKLIGIWYGLHCKQDPLYRNAALHCILHIINATQLVLKLQHSPKPWIAKCHRHAHSHVELPINQYWHMPQLWRTQLNDRNRGMEWEWPCMHINISSKGHRTVEKTF